MAEAALKKLEDQLNCMVCLDTYTDPKQLQCYHVFCHKCLVQLVEGDQHGQLTLTCPTCRQVTPVPASGVADLQSAFYINHLLEIVEEHKKAANSANAQKVESDSTSLAPQRIKTTICCREHAGKEVDAYCATCEEPVCMKCVIKSGKHHGHDTELMNEAFKRYKQEITSSLEPTEKQLTTVKKALAELDTRYGEISDQQAAIEANIHDSFRQLHETLDIRKTELIGQLHQITKRKLKVLAIQKDQIETTLAQLSSCLDFMKESLKADSEAEVLKIKQLKELNSTFQLEAMKPNTEADMIFSPPQDFTTLCQNYGHVYTLSFEDFPQERSKVGEQSSFALEAINIHEQPSLECDLVSEITGTRVWGRIERRGEDQYKISYQPTIKGRHQLNIKMKGQHVRGSPFSVVSNMNVEKIGTSLRTLHGVEGPFSVVLTDSGEVVVSNWESDSISVFSQNREDLRSFGLQGSDEGQFDCPSSVAVDSMGNILVADYGNSRIQKFTPDGDYLTAVHIKGDASPYAMAFDCNKAKLYVVDNDWSVQVFNSDFVYITSFGKEGSGKGQLFKTPNFVACDSASNVYVADHGHNCIQVFTEDGKFLRKFGNQGRGRGELAEPCGVAVDANDMVYVSERANHRVSVFTSEGQFVTSFGKHGSGPGEFASPCGLAIDNDGVLYVCDYRNNRIQLF